MVTAFSYTHSTATVRPRVLAEKRSSYTTDVGLSNVQEPITNALPEVRRIIERVLQAEKDKLYMKFPRNILSIAKISKPLCCKAFTLWIYIQSKFEILVLLQIENAIAP